MAANLTLAGPDDLARILPMLAACHAEQEITSDETYREGALAPLLDGSPLGAAYLIGPRKAPVGFIVVTFGWSVEMGGMVAVVDEFWIRPGVRGRGMGSEVLSALMPTLEQAGIRSVHHEAHEANPRVQALFARHRFRLREGLQVLTRRAPVTGRGTTPK